MHSRGDRAIRGRHRRCGADGESERSWPRRLRRLAVVRHQCNESQLARELCQRSEARGDRERQRGCSPPRRSTPTAPLTCRRGSWRRPRRHFLQALERGGSSRQLHARVEQNLGVVANIQGRAGRSAQTAMAVPSRAYQDANDEHGCAIAYHNLGMLSADQGTARRSRSTLPKKAWPSHSAPATCIYRACVS